MVKGFSSSAEGSENKCLYHGGVMRPVVLLIGAADAPAQSSRSWDVGALFEPVATRSW